MSNLLQAPALLRPPVRMTLRMCAPSFSQLGFAPNTSTTEQTPPAPSARPQPGTVQHPGSVRAPSCSSTRVARQGKEKEQRVYPAEKEEPRPPRTKNSSSRLAVPSADASRCCCLAISPEVPSGTAGRQEMTLLGAGLSSPRTGEKAPHAPPKRAHSDAVGVAGAGGASPGVAAIEDFPWQRVSPLPRCGAGGSSGAAGGEQGARAVPAGRVLQGG